MRSLLPSALGLLTFSKSSDALKSILNSILCVCVICVDDTQVLVLYLETRTFMTM